MRVSLYHEQVARVIRVVQRVMVLPFALIERATDPNFGIGQVEGTVPGAGIQENRCSLAAGEPVSLHIEGLELENIGIVLMENCASLQRERSTPASLVEPQRGELLAEYLMLCQSRVL
ncbi:hypothetical protein FALBO_6697 [Fusarium albosuccineum]|uniref:Uncharacterized protein n=1 Tax=Fusarium albosuccineum TaxID=1237068 RepID=A0A8H4PEE6_9HYPO|nr:hypothetical protein FALBO_6697 [Fusarium albosuccineum]